MKFFPTADKTKLNMYTLLKKIFQGFLFLSPLIDWYYSSSTICYPGNRWDVFNFLLLEDNDIPERLPMEN